MRHRVAVVCCLLLTSLGIGQAQTRPSPWAVEGDGYAVANARGNALDATGAELILQSTVHDINKTGRVGASLPGTFARLRRVTVSGELRTLAAPDGAAVWLRIERPDKPALVDYGFDARVGGGQSWTITSISLPVPTDASRISFGVRLWAVGSVEVRNLQLRVGDPLRPDGSMAPNAAAKLQAAIDIVKQHGLKRNEVSWQILDREVRTLGSGARTPSEVNAAIRYLLSEAADPTHSSLLSRAQWQGLTGAASTRRAPEGRVIDEHIGWLELPEHLVDDAELDRQYVSRAYEALQQLATDARCGWVLDLRNNGGGAAGPMLAAVRPFLGDVPIGSNVGPDGTIVVRFANEGADAALPPHLAHLQTAPVAVLIGPQTGSSAERVAISFRGRARARLVGQPSRGVTTGNDTFDLPDGDKLVVTRSVMADRTGRLYGGPVEPDILVRPIATQSANSTDPTVTAATQWLRMESTCAN